MNKTSQKRTAFSLIELSIVILVIGIIIAGITQSSRLLDQFRLSSAKTQTKNSPVSSINGLALWLETTSAESFKEEETEDATKVGETESSTARISTWYDLKNAVPKNNAVQDTASNKPLRFEKCINSLPCIRFNGSTSFMNLESIPAIIGSDYTIFVVEQRRAETGYFIGGSVASADDGRLTLGYSTSTTVRFDQGAGADSNYYSAEVTPFSTPTAVAHIFMNGYGYDNITSQVKYSPGLKYYNSTKRIDFAPTDPSLSPVGSPSNTNLSAALTNIQLGHADINGNEVFYNGDIGEIIIFNRALKQEESYAIRDYLIKKWSIK